MLDAWHTPSNGREAIAIQNELRQRVRTTNDDTRPNVIAGIDCSFDIKKNLSRAVIVVMEKDELIPLHIVTAELPTPFPYITGLLSFREMPVILEAIKKLPSLPDLFMVDGQGIAHPRGLGIASHLGVLLDMPAIGVAKSRLVGKYGEPGPTKGDTSPLIHKSERIGTVLRSRTNVKPLFISPGHRIDVGSATQLVQDCLRGLRLPEPTRMADKFSKAPYWQRLHHNAGS